MKTVDKWCLIEIENNNDIYHKLFSTFYGDFTTGDRWRLNSGIEKIEEKR